MPAVNTTTGGNEPTVSIKSSLSKSTNDSVVTSLSAATLSLVTVIVALELFLLVKIYS